MLHKLLVAEASEKSKQGLSMDGVTLSAEEEVRCKLLKRWMEVTTRVEVMVNDMENQVTPIF